MFDLKSYGYVIVPLLTSSDQLEFFKKSFYNTDGYFVDLYVTMPFFEFKRLGTVMEFYKTPCIIIGRFYSFDGSVKWWQPFKRFRFKKIG